MSMQLASPETLASMQARIAETRRYNHTLTVSELIHCPCGQAIFILKPWGFATKARVVVCPNCQDWHSILYK